MSSVDDPEAISAAKRRVRDLHDEVLTYRRAYDNARRDGPAMMDAMREELAIVVQDYYETMRPWLAGRRAVDDYWEGGPNTAVLSQQVRYVEDDGETIRLDEIPPQYRTQELLDNVKETTVYIGLKHLDDEFLRTTVETRTFETALGEVSDTRTTTETPPIEMLMRVARLLDEAADDLDLLGEVPDDVPNTVVDVSTLDDWRERMQEIVGEWSDEPTLEEQLEQEAEEAGA